MLEADPRLEEHWKVPPRVKWLDSHRYRYISDAEHMARLSTETAETVTLCRGLLRSKEEELETSRAVVESAVESLDLWL